MFEVEKKTFEVDGLTIAFTETGPQDGRVLFCVHGLLSNGRDYDFLALTLAERGYRTIAIDLPGRGGSDIFADPMLYSPPFYAPHCLALIHHVTKGTAFDWLGVSLGGMIGMGVCQVEGLALERLILVDVGAEISAAALDFVAKLAKAPSTFKSKKTAIEAFKQRCSAWGIAEDKIWDHLITHNILDGEGGACRFHYDPNIAVPMGDENETIEFWDVWGKIKQPILLIRGGKSILLPALIAHKMKTTYQGARIDEVVFEECGHVPNMMQDDHIDSITQWLMP